MPLNPSEPAVGASNRLESLTWVLEEVRKSAAIATGALAYALNEKTQGSTPLHTAGATTSSSNLKTAFSEMKRASGALKMVDQDVSARIFADIATLLNRSAISTELIDESLLKSVKSICFAVNAYLAGLCAGRVWPTTVLATVAQTAAGLAGRLAFHPAQLWVDHGKSVLSAVNWSLLGLSVQPLRQQDLDGTLLRFLKGEVDAANDLASRCAASGQATSEPVTQTLAYCGALFLLAIAQGAIPHDLYAKRTAGKLIQWLNASKQQGIAVMGLLHEIKYLLSRVDTNTHGRSLPAIAYLGQSGLLVDDNSLGLKPAEFRVIDPELLEIALHQLKGAKNDWSDLSSGELSSRASAQKHFLALHQAMLKLWPDLAMVTMSLNRCVQGMSHQAEVPSAGLSLEVATALLFIEDAMGDLYASGNTLKDKAQALFARLERVLAGAEAQDLQDWMEALYRRSGDQQAMGNVAGELRHLAAEIEKNFEAIFSAAAGFDSAAGIQKLQGLLTQMRGVLGVVGLDQGVATVAYLRGKTDTLDRDLHNPGEREQLIGNLGSNMASLGLMVDMLSYQPSLANRLFHFDRDAAVLKLLTHQGAEDVRRNAAQSAVQTAPVLVAAPATVAVATAPIKLPEPQAVGDELKGVFAQEAHHVVEEGLDSVSALALDAKDINTLVSLRRGFHTLKGSARMVGMGELGDAAWAMEQLLNEQLTDQTQPLSANLCALAKDALSVIGRWSDLLGQGRDPEWTAEPFRIAAQAIRLHDRYVALDMPEPKSAKTKKSQTPKRPEPQALTPQPVPVDQVLQAWTFGTEPETPAVQSVQSVVDNKINQALDWPDLDLSKPDPVAADAHAAAAGASAVQAVPAASENARPPVDKDEIVALKSPSLPSTQDPAPRAPTSIANQGQDAVPTDPWEASPPALPTPDEFDFNLALTDNATDSEQFKYIGPLKVRINLYNVYLQEADESSRALETTIDEWLLQPHQPLPTKAILHAHTLAGSSATVGFDALADLCRTLETVCASLRVRNSYHVSVAQVLRDAVEAVRYLLHQFAAGFLKQPDPEILIGLAQLLDERHDLVMPIHEGDKGIEAALADVPAQNWTLEAQPAQEKLASPQVEQTEHRVLEEPLSTPAPFVEVFAPVGEPPLVDDQEIRALFKEEAHELMPRIAHHLRLWLEEGGSQADKVEVLRGLHTLKGSARLAGVMDVGNEVHQMESELESLDIADAATVKQVLNRFDQLDHHLETSAFPAPVTPEASAYPPLDAADMSRAMETQPLGLASVLPVQDVQAQANANAPDTDAPDGVVPNTLAPQELEPLAPAPAPDVVSAAIVHGKESTHEVLLRARAPVLFADASDKQELAHLETSPTLRHAAVRVNARLLDTVMNRASEVIGSRARVKLEVDQLRGSLADLDTNVDKLRSQLREIEIQAESQMQSRLALHHEADAHFDPLEFDRFTRVQELTRMMAESVSDVATVQRNLQRSLDHADDGLVAQGRQSRELQRELLRTRMLPFDTLAQRLHRTVRQAERDTGKSVHLAIVGGNLELDRQQLDHLGPSLEHLLRNAVAHGIESPGARENVGKEANGFIKVSVLQDRNDVVVEIEDDGQGLNLGQIQAKALAIGLISNAEPLNEQQAFDLICLSGFTTAASVTELAGRGIGMDVVRASVHAAGGRMEALSRSGKGLTVRLVLPLTTATTQVLLVRHGLTTTALPVTMVEQVLRCTTKDLQQAYNAATLPFDNESIPFYWAGALLGTSARSELTPSRSQPVVVVRSAGRRVAMHVDETVGQQEVIVKSVGGQLSSLPGLTGVSILPNGAVVLIYNPVALALVYGNQIAQFAADRASAGQLGKAGQTSIGKSLSTARNEVPVAPLALVVDDSITVRKVTQRLLERAGYRVALAADGVQALELLRGKLSGDVPFIMLADIEMPRMDGFDLVRTMNSDPRLPAIPVVMITSRLAEKHRELALNLGVKHYLGKPFAEEQFLDLVAQYSGRGTSGRPAGAG